MFSAMNCFARARVQPLGGEALLVLSSESPDVSLIGDAFWEEGMGPTSSVAALNLSRPGSAADVLEGEGVAIGGESYSVCAWLELPLAPNEGRERVLAACGDEPASGGAGGVVDEIMDDGDDDDDGCAAICVSGSGELGCRRERVEGFAGCGFFVDDLTQGWYHVAAVSDFNFGGSTRFMVNGRFVGTANARVTTEQRLRRLGSRVPSRDSKRVFAEEFWGGRVADFRLFQRPLDNDEINTLFSGGPFASVAAHAPQLPPKHERAKRAARERLSEASRLVDDALQMLDASRDLVISSCLDALPDLAPFADNLRDHAADIRTQANKACTDHGLLLPCAHPILQQRISSTVSEEGEGDEVTAAAVVTPTTEEGEIAPAADEI